ncbi:regulatory protein [Proteus mirabilis]|uniref:Regulatory protein n=1 Tax=Proteus mirabilis TaxID=584 RepID=A0A2X2BPW6_PROMI|nr:regulatory protein [Proteus mirabilis]
MKKTITRLFYKETGLSYQQWRQQWRLMKAIELLATHHRYLEISQLLGFASDSAFITFFKKNDRANTTRVFKKLIHTNSIKPRKNGA